MKKEFKEAFFSSSFENKYDSYINDTVSHCKTWAIEKWGISSKVPPQALRVLSAPYPRKFDDADLKIKFTKNKKLMTSNHQATVFLLADFEVFIYRLTYSIVLPVKNELSAVFSYKDIISLIVSEGVGRYKNIKDHNNEIYCPEKICRLSIANGYNLDFFMDNNKQSFDTVMQIRKELFTKKAYQKI
ncbi:MAG TPA: hypothetical protein VIL26_07785 [Clostridia bacterium]